MNCNYCGAQLLPNAKVCHYCGTQVAANNGYPMEGDATRLIMDYAPMNQPPVQKKKSNTGIIAAIAVFAVIIVAVGAVLLGYTLGSKPDDNKENAPAAVETEVLEQTEKQTQSTTVPPVTQSTTAETTTETTTSAPTVPQFSYDDKKPNTSSQFLFDSANKYITKEYLSGCTRDEVLVIMNEIYARHGYIFKDAELRDYFNSQSWYEGTEPSMDEVSKYFNDIEIANINTIYSYQKDMGWR